MDAVEMRIKFCLRGEKGVTSLSETITLLTSYEITVKQLNNISIANKMSGVTGVKMRVPKRSINQLIAT